MVMNAPEREDDRNNSLNKVYMQPLPLQHQEVAERFGIEVVTAGFGQTESGAPRSVTIDELAEGEGTPADLYRGYSREQIRELTVSGGSLVRTGAEVTRKGVMGVVNPFLETMPKYMHPKHIRVVDQIPRAPTNKIEKYKLRQQILGELLAPGTDG